MTIASTSRTEVNVVPLNDVAHFIRGVTFKPEDVVPIGTPGSVACMRTKNVQTTIDLADVWALPSVLIRRDDQLVAPGDLLVSTANSWNLVGKCCWVPTLPWPTTFGGFISVLRPDAGMVYPRYLFHWFGSQHTQETVRSFGQRTTSISNLNIERTLALAIPLPPLAEQRRISELLDKADALRIKRRAALIQLDSLSHAAFVELFGDYNRQPDRWPIVRLGELVASTELGLVRGAQDLSPMHPYPYLRMNAIGRRGRLGSDGLSRTQATAQEVGRYGLAQGDFLFNTRNSEELVGKTALFRRGPSEPRRVSWRLVGLSRR